MVLSYFGLRVRDVPRSVRLYTEVFGLEVVSPPEWNPGSWDAKQALGVLLRDRVSGARLELNYYPPGNPYAVPYAPGEELDHLAFRVDELDPVLAKLAARGIHPEEMKHFSGPVMETPDFRVAYVRDPDGAQIEIYELPKARGRPYDPHSY